jgi:hypothetical protein
MGAVHGCGVLVLAVLMGVAPGEASVELLLDLGTKLPMVHSADGDAFSETKTPQFSVRDGDFVSRDSRLALRRCNKMK